MTETAPAPAPRPLRLVVSRDGFGARIAAALNRLDGPARLDARQDVDGVEELEGVALVVLAGLRPDDDVARALAAVAWRAGVPFLPVRIEQPQLVVGPYVRRGESACFDCYRRRLVQHDPAAASSAHLATAYAADPALRPAGWLAAHAELAAALVAATSAGRPGGLLPGEVRMLDELTLLPTDGVVVGFTGCPTCDPVPTEDRSWTRLAAAWPVLLGGAA